MKLSTYSRRALAALAALALPLAVSQGLTAQCDATIDAGRGPVTLVVPDSYDPDRPSPLVVHLHGYASTADAIEHWLRLEPLAQELGFLYLLPQGSIDEAGQPFWNAGPVCCNWYNSAVDDIEYLRRLVDEVGNRCRVDPGRIYWIGHSNGAYMAYRIACEHAELVTGLTAIAGVTENEPTNCNPFKPVHVLHVHGTADDFWEFEGGVWSANGEPYPGALRTAEIWAEYDGCGPKTDVLAGKTDIESGIEGAETTVTRFAGPCRPGGSVEMWEVAGAGHVPEFSPEFSRKAIEWLLANRNECRGRERIRRARCRSRKSRLTLTLTGGLPGDSVGLVLSTGETARGRLDTRGRIRLRLASPAESHGTVDVRWGCGATTSMTFACR
ncbi:MAG: alpha/beta hydrolase family esterase [Thermoanaerobaculia bacterium]